VQVGAQHIDAGPAFHGVLHRPVVTVERILLTIFIAILRVVPIRRRVIVTVVGVGIGGALNRWAFRRGR
jgi:hypothetical protein